MRNPITWIALACLSWLLRYQFSCDAVCTMNKINVANQKELQQLSWQIADTESLLSWLKAQYNEVEKKVEYGSWLIGMYVPMMWGVAYAGRDEKPQTVIEQKVDEVQWAWSWDQWTQAPTKILIHHSATPWSNDYTKVLRWINSAHAKRVHGTQPSNQIRDDFADISYHYVIFPDGHIEQTRRETRIWRGTRENNKDTIHILLIGNFNDENPSDAQYDSLNSKITDIQTRRSIGSIKGHGQNDGEHTACPWDHFDYMRVDQIAKWTPVSQTGNYLWVFKMTSYYSPQANQSHYFYSHTLKRVRTVEEEIKMNCWYKTDKSLERNVEQCKYPANGMELLPDHAWKMVACPGELKLGTKILIEGYGEVTCVDRGSAIGSNRLDFWSWYGDTGLNNIEKGVLWIPKTAKVYLIK